MQVYEDGEVDAEEASTVRVGLSSTNMNTDK